MTTRLKRAQATYAEADTAAGEALDRMACAEIAWMKTKVDPVRWGEWDEREQRRKACLRELRRARNDLRRHLRVALEAANDVERLTEDRDRRQAVALRAKQRQQRRATVAELAAGAGADLAGASA